MLYFKALRDGLDAMPAADPELRAPDRRARRRPGLAGAACRTAARRSRHRRTAGAERCAAHPARAGGLGIDRASPCRRCTRGASRRQASTPDPWPLIALEPTSRAWLHERIAQRFDAMLAAGLVDEVRRLRLRRDLRPDMPSMRCVGYRQAWAALDSGDARATCATPASPPRASSPSARSPGCARWPRTRIACDHAGRGSPRCRSLAVRVGPLSR